MRRRWRNYLTASTSTATILNDIILDIKLLSAKVDKDRNIFRCNWFVRRSSIPVMIVTGLKYDEIISKSRKRNISDARKCVAWLSRKCGELPLTMIASAICRDHTTIIYMINSVDSEISNRSGNCFRIIEECVQLEGSWYNIDHSK